MSLRPWLSGFRARIQKSQKVRRSGSGSRRAVQLVQPLEQRTLLTATALVIGTDLTVLTDAAENVTVQANTTSGNAEVLINGNVLASGSTVPAGSLTSLTIVTGSGDNQIDLSGVTASVFTSLAAISVDSGDGDDVIVGAADVSSSLSGGDGNDSITGGTSAEVIRGGDGQDTIDGGDGNDDINAGDGDDSVLAGAGDDTVTGDDGDDTIFGGGGNDSVIANNGADSLFGEAGDDTLNGDGGFDSIDGGTGNDTVFGGADNDTLSGGDGDDLLNGQAGDDIANGDAGNDTALGGGGSDSLLGNVGDDILNGQSGDDTLNGDADSDRLYGGSGSDSIDGGEGNDTAHGNSGDDTIVGGSGIDFLNGGTGDDIVFSLPVANSLSIDDLAILEGASGTFTVQFTLNIDFRNDVEARVDFTTVAGTASEGTDFLANSGTVVFSPGETTRTIDVQIVNDDVVETEESFSVLLSNPVNLLIADQQGDAIITDNDVAVTQQTSDGTIDATRTVTLTDSLNGVPMVPANLIYFAPSALGDFDGDGIPDLVIGARGQSGVNNPGNVYVHLMNSDGTVRTTTTFTINSPDFGTDVSVIGDVNGDGVTDLAVGSDVADGGNGAVFIVFMNADGTMQSNTKIGTNLNGGPALRDDDLFGTSVTALGDVDGDGVPDIAVGAPAGGTAASNFVDRGAVFVLLLNSDGTAKSSEILEDNNLPPGLVANGFGLTVEGIGDLNGDGVPDLAAGSNRDFVNGNLQLSGSVLVIFLNSDGTAQSVTKLGNNLNGAPTINTGDFFGGGLALLDDLDGDGVRELLIGSPRTDTAGPGAIYIAFMNSDGTIKSTTQVTDGLNGGPTLSNGDGFGRHVTAIGDLDGDGLSELAVGARSSDVGGTDQGSVFVMFLNNTGTVTESMNTGPGNGSFSPTSTTINLIDSGDTILGGTGNDTLIGNSGNDSVNGGSGDDSIDAGSGNDTVLGGSGRDTIDGGAGDDSLDGQGGADSINGGDDDDEIVYHGNEDGNDTIFGGNGADTVTVNTGVTDDTLGIAQDALGRVTVTEGSSTLVVDPSISIVNVNGQAGTDMITVGDLSGVPLSALTVDGGVGPDTIDATGLISGSVRVRLRGGDGNDTITGGVSGDSLFGDAGDDSIDGGAGNDSIQGGDGDDVINTQDGDDTADGGAGDDSVTGGLGNDSLLGGLDGDTLVGNEGDDTLRGGFGDDNLNGNSGNDSLDGSFGRDSISGGSGDDVADGGRDADLINGQAGNDTLRGNHGDDTLNGQAGDDEIVGGDGNDRVSGGSGRDGIAGNDGDDTLNGNGGSDTLRGNDGNDSLVGGSSDDTLIGDQGDDILDGEAGTDLAVTGEGDDRTLNVETIDESFMLSDFQLTKLDGI